MADTTHVGVWSVLEVGVGIIVACCPALRVLLRKAGDNGQLSSRQRGAQVSAERSLQSRGLAGLRELGHDLHDDDDHVGVDMSHRVTPDEKEVYRLRELERERRVEMGEGTNASGDSSLETLAFRHCENRPQWN